MLFNKRAFAARHAASKDETRYNLNGVFVEPDGTCAATDGHILIQTKTKHDPVADYPQIPGVELTEDPLEQGFILPTASADALVKAFPKKTKTRNLPILENAALDVETTNANGIAKFVTTDLENKSVIEARKIEGVFPNYRQVIPSQEPTASVALNPELLERVLKAVKEFQADSKKMIRIEIIDDMTAVKITATNEAEEELLALVMPMRN